MELLGDQILSAGMRRGMLKGLEGGHNPKEKQVSCILE